MKKVFLEKASLGQARARWFEALEQAGCLPARSETVTVAQATGRISARPIHARRPVPHVRASAMDGIAVRATDTAGARIDQPLQFERGTDFLQVDTGDPMPEGFDAVIMLEELDFVEGDVVAFRKAAFPGQNVRPPAEDFAEDDAVLEAHVQIRPEVVAACLATGNLEIEVLQKPRVLAIPTGSELFSPLETDTVPSDKFPETNAALFEGYLRRWKAEVTIHPLLEDDEGQIRQAVERGVVGYDVVLISAGTSKGREDFTTPVLAELGEVVVHGVSMHPGHPVVLGVIGKVPVVGVPGYPVATWVTLDQFVLPLLERYYGCQIQPRQTVKVRLAKKVHSPLGEVEFIRVRLEEVDEGFLAHQLTGKASALSSLIRADGVLVVAEAVNGIAAGEEVEVRLL